MPNIAWFNDNQYRDYPFISRADPLNVTTDFYPPAGQSVLFDLPSAAIVDFGVIMDIDAEFDSAADTVYLHSLSRVDDTYVFVFRTTSEGAENYELVFYRDIADPEGTRSYVYASSIYAEPAPEEPCVESTKWSGFLITGDLSSLSTLFPSDVSIPVSPGLWQLEPARVQNLSRGYVRSITLANAPRTMVQADATCQGSESLSSDDPIVISRCMDGDVKFKEGFNCGIRQDTNNNAMIISAGLGIGAGEPCEEIPLYDSESPPSGGQLLSGGPTCAEIVRSINGVGGTNITFLAGNGLRIDASPTLANTLVIDRALDDFAQCHGLDTNSSVTFYE